MFDKKKEILTLKHIEEDVVHSLKKPREMTEDAYKKTKLGAALIGIPLAVISAFNYKIGLFALIIFIAVVIVWGVVEILFLRNKRKTVSADDFDVTTEVLSNTVEEIYRQKSNRYYRRGGINRNRKISNYTLRFENGKSWRVPETNYEWSEEHKMSAFSIYQSSHRGDTFIVATNKATGEIAMAYSTEFFEYKNTTA